MPTQRSLRRDREINLPYMNTVNVVFSRFICYLIWFSVIVISGLNLLGLEVQGKTIFARLIDNKFTSRLGTSKQALRCLLFCIRSFYREWLFLTTCKSATINGIHSVRIIFWNTSSQAVIGWILICPCSLFLFCSPQFSSPFSIVCEICEKKNIYIYDAGEKREM